MTPISADSVLNDVPEQPSGISKKAEFWTMLVQKLGLPTVGCIAFMWGGWQVCSWLGTKVIEPAVATHTKTLETLADSSKQTADNGQRNAASFESLANSHREQTTLLKEIHQGQKAMVEAITGKKPKPVAETPPAGDEHGSLDNSGTETPGIE